MNERIKKPTEERATERTFGLETLCLHAGQQPDAATGARAMPIYQTAAFIFDDAEQAAALFNLQTFGNIYSRMMNPTNAAFEERMAALEGGRAAVATASGMAAQATALLTILQAGDEIVAARTLYGGSVTQLGITFGKMGITTHFVDATAPDNFRRAITPKTRALYAETIGNPLGNILDITAVADIAHEAGVPLVVDNTMATPCLCRPLAHGADIVVHSATKYIGGHGTSMGGVLIERGTFPWNNGNFIGMTEPSPGYHGIRFYETFGDFAFTMKARAETLRTLGPTLSPFNGFLMLQGLETLPLRMERHCRNAEAVADFLARHKLVSWVRYAGGVGRGGASGDNAGAGDGRAESGDDARESKLRRKYLPSGAGGVLSFGIRGGSEAGVRFIEAAQLMSHVANIGDARTLVVHPASTTHRQLSAEEQTAAGVTPEMVRLSIGLETVDDILWDIDQALAVSQAG